MPGYTVSNKEKTIFTAEKLTDKSRILYEFWKSENGWFIQCDQWSVDNPWPIHNEMWLPEEVINEIISPKTAKKFLEQ